MKKLLIFVCTLICLFGLVGCVQKESSEKSLASSQLMIDSVAPTSVRNIFTEECANISDDKDIETISSILFVDSWNVESLTNCSNNIEITIDGTTYLYHSDCGTFNDTINQRYLSLDDETTNIVNTLFAKYVSLTSSKIPEE